jgi:hypothetical protein
LSSAASLLWRKFLIQLPDSTQGPYPNPLPGAASTRFSQAANTVLSGIHLDPYQCAMRNSLSGAGSARNAVQVCTKSGQAPVDGLHSLENAWGYKERFFVDEKDRRSTTRSFFDSFLSFSGWCGVRGSSEVTF